MRTGFPFSGNVMRKNLAVFGSDDWALAKPLNADVVVVVCNFAVWFCDDPAKAHPIQKLFVTRIMKDALFIFYHRLSPNAINKGVSALLELEFLAGLLGRPAALPSAEHQLSVLDLVVCDVAQPAVTAHIALSDPRGLVPFAVNDLRVFHTRITCPRNHTVVGDIFVTNSGGISIPSRYVRSAKPGLQSNGASCA